MKQSRSLLAPLMENFLKRLSNADARLRRKAIRIGFWVIGVLFVYSLMSGTYGIPRIIRLEMQKESLLKANRQVLMELIDNSGVKKMLISDRRYIEFIARTRYYMVRPNETVYYYRGQ